MTYSEDFFRTLDTLHTLSEVYRNIQGGPETSRKPLVQLADMIADLTNQLSRKEPK